MMASTSALPAGIAPFVCPCCRDVLTPAGIGELYCARDDASFVFRAEIWRFLTPEDAALWREFLTLYRSVRADEGWGRNADSEYFRALPQVPRGDPHAAIWKVRAASFRVLQAQTVRPLARRLARPLAIVDLGAGNAWLANRLAESQHTVAAVDLDDDAADGLGAGHHYGKPSIVPVQASFERLPWPASTFDLAIFNGSLHYAPDAATSLGEALRVLRPGGRLVILDTPFYHHRSSGETMVAERDRLFARRHGTASTIRHEGFLTRGRLAALARRLSLAWRVKQPWYGLGWASRPLKNRILGRREPVRFLFVEGRRDS